MKLILTTEIQSQVDEILTPLIRPDEWASYKLSFAPNPSAVIRMEGAPGTGKTALANYLAKKLGKPPLHLDFASVASTQFGETEGKIKALFDHAHETETPTIIMEEADALLWSRDKVTEDTMFALGLINTLLIQIDRFIARKIPSLLIVTSNYPQLLDAALESRITDVIKLSPPRGDHAMKVWKSKLPVSMRDATEAEWEHLVTLNKTPREIENIVRKSCRCAMVAGVKPTFSNLAL